MSTKESYVEIAVNPSGEEHVGRVTPSTGLYVQSQDCAIFMYERSQTYSSYCRDHQGRTFKCLKVIVGSCCV
ncbi:hypothetical protein JHK85_006711 [Glycine max]|nr:hypothetical protein JHK85_006711 [Glycine max]